MSGAGGGSGRVGVVGALSGAGKELGLALERAGLGAEFRLFGGDESVGTLTEFAGFPQLVQGLSGVEAADLDVLVFCADSEALAPAIAHLAEAGPAILDLTRTLPLGGHARLLSGAEDVVACAAGSPLCLAHPAAIVAARLVAAFAARGGVRRLRAVVLEPVAERGEPGIDELYEQTREVLAFRAAPMAALGARIAFNVVPASGGPEARLRSEIAILGALPAAAVDAVLLRVPVFHGLSIDLRIEVDPATPPSAEVLRSVPGVRLGDEPVLPGALPEEEGEAAPALHVRVLDGQGESRRLWVVTDHLRLSPAVLAARILDRLQRS